MGLHRKILVSGHRGYKDKEIENTWNAFERAIDEGIDFIEFDVKMTRDNVPVVFHDDNMQRLLGVPKRIGTVTLDELRGYHHTDGQGVLTLDDFLQRVDGRIGLMLEIKASNAEASILRLLRKHGMRRRTIVQSFNGMVIKRCHAMDPGGIYGVCIGPVGNVGPIGARTGLHHLVGTIAYLITVKPYPVRYINVDGPLVNDQFMKACTRQGIRTILGAQKTWMYLDKIDEWNVDIVNADDPGHIKTLLGHAGHLVS